MSPLESCGLVQKGYVMQNGGKAMSNAEPTEEQIPLQDACAMVRLLGDVAAVSGG